MIRHSIESRPHYAQKLAWFGIGYPSSAERAHWNESVCYELSQHEADSIFELTNELYELMVAATDQFIERGHFHSFGYSIEQARLLATTWEDSDYLPTLFTCFDFDCHSSGHPLLIGLEAETPALLLESAVAQWDWAQERVPWAVQFNTIEERLLGLWRDYRFQGRTVHLGYNAGNLSQFLTAEYLKRVAEYAGVTPIIIAYSEIRLDSGAGRYLDQREKTIDLLINLGKPESIAQRDAAEAYQNPSICLCEPYWKSLWAHPRWIDFVSEYFPHPAFSRRAPKSTQNNTEVRCSSWVIAGQACGVGITERMISGGFETVQFVPHLLTS